MSTTKCLAQGHFEIQGRGHTQTTVLRNMIFHSAAAKSHLFNQHSLIITLTKTLMSKLPPWELYSSHVALLLQRQQLGLVERLWKYVIAVIS